MLSKRQKLFNIILLILAGEANFILPFVLARIFRPTVLDLFELSNLQLGACFSIYGIVAFISYLLGGSLADKFQPRYLMAFSLFLTALGGMYMSTYPSYMGLSLLYGYWGFTTIFLFWAAMIKATRIWGGQHRQGIAFGLLDGGRGLISFAFGWLGILIFSILLVNKIEDSSLLERKEAYRYIVLICSIIIALIGVLLIMVLKDHPHQQTSPRILSTRQVFNNYLNVIKLPSVWLLMIIILCAYTGYKITDIYSQYANEVMGYNETDAAAIGSNLLGIRIIIGIIIGLLADKTRSSLMMIISFTITIIGAFIFVSGLIQPDTTLLFGFTIITVATGVYAFRTLYFAAIQEGKIPMAVTGTAVGLISLVGYTPDIFMGPAMGILLDNSPGSLGFQKVFLMLAIFAIVGLIAAYFFHRINTRELPQEL
ncbi:MFS transporter [Nonlabens arenilitoris]|uniref:MFS transporter n=1 Tax=Nonlabens arenilitoris TaxID=1217969 RepID=A0A2S7UD40_9FLAO|nr:MFS transporter [Nonlabens arenilitoris]PQJ32530.1 MFS transporter [Nonlabens arenilitoris]